MNALYVFGGLPGTGKTTLARLLAQDIGAAYLRIDTIEDALLGTPYELRGPEGYVVAYKLASDNLRLGRNVVADCVNPVHATRSSWRDVSVECGVELVAIEICCSDAEEHRRRVESRPPPTSLRRVRWRDVVEREYEAWQNPSCRIDTAGRTIAQSYGELRRSLRI